MSDLDQLCPIPLENEHERLIWRAGLTPDLITGVHQVHWGNKIRYRVSIAGRVVSGDWEYDLAWMLIVGAQCGAEAMTSASP